MDTVRIERFTSRVEADLACSMLTARGFNARVSGDDVAGVHPDIPFGIGGTAVVVPRDQYEDAIALLDEEFEGPLGDTDGPDERAGDEATPTHGPDGDTDPPDPSTAQRDGPGDTRDASTDAGADDHDPDVPWSRDAQRRPGMRVFAVAAATALLVAFLAASGVAAGWL